MEPEGFKGAGEAQRQKQRRSFEEVVNGIEAKGKQAGWQVLLLAVAVMAKQNRSI